MNRFLPGTTKQYIEKVSQPRVVWLLRGAAKMLLGHGQQLGSLKAVLGGRETARLRTAISPKEADLADEALMREQEGLDKAKDEAFMRKMMT